MLWLPRGGNSALIHYGFENFKLNEIFDDSGNNINAALVSGSYITKVQSKCGAAADMDGGEIVIEGSALRGRQMETVTIAMWVNLKREEENLSLFNIDPATDGHGAVITLEVMHGKLHWSHQNGNGMQIFDLLTPQRGSVPQGLWTHVAASYDSHKGQAKLYLDTQLIKEAQGNGAMSSHFHGKVSIGKDGTLPGVVDEFYLFEKALSYTDITDLSELCDIGGEYSIPMDKSGYTSGHENSEGKRLHKWEMGHRHSSIEDKSDNDDEKFENQCHKQAVLYSTGIRGGKTAGIFNDVGDMLTIDACVRRCCAAPRCDVAYLEKGRCYNVICHFPSLCQPVTSDTTPVTLGYVMRNGRSVYQPDETTTPKLIPTTHHTPVTHHHSSKKPEKHTCLQSMVYYGVALRGGWTAGKFSDRGFVPSLKRCIDLCCKDLQCDLIMLLSQKCFTIHCYNLQDCQTIPNGHAQIAYVSRDQMTSSMTAVDPFPPTKHLRHLTHPPHKDATNPHPTHRHEATHHSREATLVPTMSGKRSDLVLHYSFEHVNEEEILDESGNENNGQLTNDVNVSPGGGIRGNGLLFQGGELLLDGQSFNPKPTKAVSIVLWIKLRVTQKKHTLFAVIGKEDPTQSYFLEVINGRVIWKHMNRGQRVFSAETGPVLGKFTWQHVAATYDGDSHEVKIYVDGKIQSIGIGHGSLSQDWDKRAGFGVYQEGKALDSFMDEIYIYTSALYGDEIGHYVINFKEKGRELGSVSFPTRRKVETTTTTTKEPSNKLTRKPARHGTRRHHTRKPTHRPTRKSTPRSTRHTTRRYRTTHHVPLRTTYQPTPKWGHGSTAEPHPPTRGRPTSTRVILGHTLGPTLTKKRKMKTTIRVTKIRTTKRRKTPTKHKKTPTKQQKTPTKQRKVATKPPKTLTKHRKTPTKMPPTKHKTTTSTRKTTAPTTKATTATTTTKPATTTKQTTTATTTTTKSPTKSGSMRTTIKGILTIKSPTESSICTHGLTYKYADLRGGLSSGNFLDRGLTSGIGTCMDLCCEHKTCDLAYVMSNRCYLVECYSVELCGIIPKGVNMISPIIGMVRRPDSPKIPELSDFVSIQTTSTSRPLHSSRCKFGDVMNHTTFVGGLKAGNFSNRGQVTTMETCQDLCCNWKSCDVAVMMKHTCFLVSCTSMELCKPRPAHLSRFTLVLSYRDRKAEEEEQVIELLKATPMPSTKKPLAHTTIRQPKTTEKTTTMKTTKPTSELASVDKPRENTTASKGDNSTIIIPEPLQPNKNVLSWCLPSFIVEGVDLRGGLGSGSHTSVGKVDNMDMCMKKCCEMKSCTTAYYDSQICYAIRCLDKDLCKVRVSVPQHKVGYIIRNGWALFKKNSEVMEGAIINNDLPSTTTTVTATTVRTTSSPTTVLDMKLLTQKNPTQLAKEFYDFGYCRSDETLIDHRLVGGMKSGVFTEHGIVNNFRTCVEYCCKDRTCDLAYQVGLSCYGIKCFDTNSCRIFNVPKYFLNPRMAFVSRDPTQQSGYGAILIIPTRRHPYNVQGKADKNGNSGELGAEVQERLPVDSPLAAVKEVHQSNIEPEEHPSTSRRPVSQPKKSRGDGEQHDLGSKRRKDTAKKKLKSTTTTTSISDATSPEPGTSASTSTAVTSVTSHSRHHSHHHQKHHHEENAMREKAKKVTSDDPPFHDWTRYHKRKKSRDKTHTDDSSGSGNEISEVTSGSGFFDRLQEIQSDLKEFTDVSHLLLKTGNPKPIKKMKSKKQEKKKEKSLAAKKDEANKPPTHKHVTMTQTFDGTQASDMMTTGIVSTKFPSHTFFPQPIPMTDVDLELIQAISPSTDHTDCNPTRYGCEHYCIPLFHGGYRCICKQGYKLALDGKHCLYQGACDARAHGCDQKCEYNGDGFECACRSGYIMRRLLNGTCEDMDECAMGINGCSDICVNTQGSYICDCSKGYILASDRLKCELAGDLYKKSRIPHPDKAQFTIPAMIISSTNRTIINQTQNMLLQCKTFGFPSPALVWTMEDRALTSLLQMDTRVTFLPGGYMLLQSAFVNDSGRYTCVSSNIAGTDISYVDVQVNDIDECLTGEDSCHQLCLNTNGSYRCDCYDGYALGDDHLKCEDIDECNIPFHCHQHCWNTPGSYHCGCNKGYLLSDDKKHCNDIDECASPTTSRCSQMCHNTLGSYRCMCAHGYKLADDNRTCLLSPTKDKHHGGWSHTKTGGGSKNGVSYTLLMVCAVISVAAITGTLLYLLRNYKKRWKLDESNTYAPPDGFLRNLPVGE